jgi:ribosome biogenesis GTPase
VHGIVIRNTGNSYIVRTDDGQEVECKVKGTFRLRGIRSTSPVAVGDGVTVKAPTDTGDDPIHEVLYITDIDERRNYIIRKASNLSKQSHILAANIDLALLVVTMARPETTTTFIDRFLASAEAYRVPVALVFNKMDDLNDEERADADVRMDIYRAIGYDCYALSALHGDGLEPLLQAMRGRICLLAGHSGVGKSTLLNRLVPTAHARTAEVSEAHGTGMHTTTFSELDDLPGDTAGGAVIDIPGIKGFGTFDMQPEEVAHYFRDIFRLSAHCRFNNCTHTHEPGCAVLEALQDFRLAPTRYASYLSMLDDKDEGKYRAAY